MKCRKVRVGKSGWSYWQKPVMNGYMMQCCDCGLVHDVVWSYDKKTKELGMAVRRNNRATAQRRKSIKKES